MVFWKKKKKKELLFILSMWKLTLGYSKLNHVSLTLYHVYLYNILGGRPSHPSVLSSIHPSSSSRKKKMMEIFQNARFTMHVFMGDFSTDFRH